MEHQKASLLLKLLMSFIVKDLASVSHNFETFANAFCAQNGIRISCPLHKDLIFFGQTEVGPQGKTRFYH